MSLALVLAGCGRKGADAYGQEISERNVTKLNAILAQPDNFEGKTVTVEGKIIQECPTGCWFDIKDEAGMIHVDIKPSGFAIPQKVGKTVKVEGQVSVKNNKPVLIGKGVEIK
jgi:uncharacterized protein YdeI (BOF family)